MSSKSERFVKERREYWGKMSQIILKIEKKGYKSLSTEEIIEFPNLYRKIATDSEIAKTLNLSPDTIEYVQELVKYAHNILYSVKMDKLENIKRLIFEDFPKAFLSNFYSILTIFLLFFGTGVIVFFYTYNNPEFIKEILPEYFIQVLKESYQQGIERNINENIYMAAYYIYNNISIAFMSFILGVTFGIGTVATVVYNSVIIGSIAGYLVFFGYSYNFLNFVIAHSAFELLGITLTSGAGFAIGFSLIRATEEKRSIVLRKKVKEVMPILITGSFFILIAAFIEGFISASNIKLNIKIMIFILSLFFIFILSYKIFFVKIRKKFLINELKGIRCYFMNQSL